jgi:transcriptional regulator with XRE-family HTH domain
VWGGNSLPKRSLAALGGLVREHRGLRKLRETAAEIGISPATLLRVESGRIPDVLTFGKLCIWLQLDPKSFLGFKEHDLTRAETGVAMSAHFKADRHPQEATIRALAQMLLLAANPPIEEPSA